MSALVIIRFVRQNIVRGYLLLIVKSYQSLLITTLIMKLPAKSGYKRGKNECKKKKKRAISSFGIQASLPKKINKHCFINESNKSISEL